METDSKCLTVTEQNFTAEVLESKRPVLVDFWAPWCGPCRTIAPVIEEVANRFDGRAKVAKVNVDEQRGLAERYGVRSIPTLAFFRNGQLVEQAIGAVPTPILVRTLEGLLRPSDRADECEPMGVSRGAA